MISRDLQSHPLAKYIQSLYGEENQLMKKSRYFAEQLGLGHISISQAEGMLIRWLVEQQKCKKFIEIGTLTGLSGQYILEGMDKNTEFWSIEKEEKHYIYAMKILSEILNKKVNLIHGDAQKELRHLEKFGPFDGIFIDGNKSAYFDYLKWGEKNLRKGALILADNVLLGGGVWGNGPSHFGGKQIEVMKRFNKRLADSKLYKSILIPTSDGIFAAIKNF